VTAETVVPAYDVTVGAGGLQGSEVDLAAWWRSVVGGPYSTAPRDDLADRPLVLACVASAYAPFFSDALGSVSPARLRIFGSGLARHLNGALSHAVMPYDDRLDVLVPGTRADFAQRALRHYLFNIGPSTDAEGDKRRIEAALNGLPKHRIRSGQSLGDDEIRASINQIAAETGMARTAMLRHFRDVLGIACEQSRFARLYEEAQRNGR
jgi:AraC-like DNA-binding protein